jgi:hypothetical protein
VKHKTFQYRLVLTVVFNYSDHQEKKIGLISHNNIIACVIPQVEYNRAMNSGTRRSWVLVAG